MPCILKGAVLTLVICLLNFSTAQAHTVHHTHKAAVFHMRAPTMPTFKVAMPTDFASYVEVSSGINFSHTAELSKFGASTLTLKGVEGVGTSIAFGVGNESDLAAEVEYSFRSGAVDVSVAGSFAEGYLQSHSVMGNGIFKLATPELAFQPYFGLGAGYLWQEAEIANINGSGATFAYQALAGAKIQFTDQAAAALEYKYQTTEDFDLDFQGSQGIYSLDSASNSTIQLGVQMQF